MRHINESVIVSVDFSEKDKGVLIVGRQRKGRKVDIINAFQGEEAWELYKKLTIREGKGSEHASNT